MRTTVSLFLPLVLGLSGPRVSGQASVVPQQKPAASVVFQSTPDRFVLKVLAMAYDKRSIGVTLLATERLPGGPAVRQRLNRRRVSRKSKLNWTG